MVNINLTLIHTSQHQPEEVSASPVFEFRWLVLTKVSRKTSVPSHPHDLHPENQHPPAHEPPNRMNRPSRCTKLGTELQTPHQLQHTVRFVHNWRHEPHGRLPVPGQHLGQHLYCKKQKIGAQKNRKRNRRELRLKKTLFGTQHHG